MYGPVSAINACLQLGAAGLATRAGSADATDAAMAATAVTAETATTMAFLIDMPSFEFPRIGYSLFDVEPTPELPERVDDECLPALVGRL